MATAGPSKSPSPAVCPPSGKPNKSAIELSSTTLSCTVPSPVPVFTET